MAVNKVVSGNKTLIDISDSTVAPNKMLKGTVAYGANGEKVNGDIEVVNRAPTTISSSLDDGAGDTIVITANNAQSTGYVTGSNESAKKTISMSVNGAKVTATDGNTSISKSVASTSVATPTMTTSAIEGEDEICIRATNNQTEGYVSAKTTYKEAFVKLTVDGNKATISSGGASISRTIGTFETWVFEMKDGTTIEKVVNVD